MWNIVYQITLSIALLVVGPIVLLRRRSHYSTTLVRRLGFRLSPATPTSRPVWIHAVSVGEVGVAATVAAHLPPALPLLVTTVTPTGQQRALAAFPQATVDYLPFDLGFAVRRFFAHHRPRLLVLTEGDLWPTVLRRARRQGVPIVIINGRIGDQSFRRLRRLKPLILPLIQPVDCFGVQTDRDRQRLVELGVEPDKIRVTGNLKFDSSEPELSDELSSLFRHLAGDRAILIAGSTMPGEEDLVLSAFRDLDADREALLVLAPRHPERWPEVATLLEQSGLPWTRRTATDLGAGEEPAPAVVLLDSLGELPALYSVAVSAFIGGTLVPSGGHNPLEPARFGVPVVAGPSMENFQEIAASFDASQAWMRVSTASELTRCWADWLRQPRQAREVGRRGALVVEQQRGALERTLQMLQPWLAKIGGSP